MRTFTMVAVFLVHFTVGGAEVLTEMALEDSSSTYFLPNDPREDGIKLTSVLDEQHSHLCLGLFWVRFCWSGLTNPLRGTFRFHPPSLV